MKRGPPRFGKTEVVLPPKRQHTTLSVFFESGPAVPGLPEPTSGHDSSVSAAASVGGLVPGLPALGPVPTRALPVVDDAPCKEIHDVAQDPAQQGDVVNDDRSFCERYAPSSPSFCVLCPPSARVAISSWMKAMVLGVGVSGGGAGSAGVVPENTTPRVLFVVGPPGSCKAAYVRACALSLKQEVHEMEGIDAPAKLLRMVREGVGMNSLVTSGKRGGPPMLWLVTGVDGFLGSGGGNGTSAAASREAGFGKDPRAAVADLLTILRSKVGKVMAPMVFTAQELDSPALRTLRDAEDCICTVAVAPVTRQLATQALERVATKAGLSMIHVTAAMQAFTGDFRQALIGLEACSTSQGKLHFRDTADTVFTACRRLLHSGASDVLPLDRITSLLTEQDNTASFVAANAYAGLGSRDCEEAMARIADGLAVVMSEAGCWRQDRPPSDVELETRSLAGIMQIKQARASVRAMPLNGKLEWCAPLTRVPRVLQRLDKNLHTVRLSGVQASEHLWAVKLYAEAVRTQKMTIPGTPCTTSLESTRHLVDRELLREDPFYCAFGVPRTLARSHKLLTNIVAYMDESHPDNYKDKNGGL
jgi:hypothetical protein